MFGVNIWLDFVAEMHRDTIMHVFVQSSPPEEKMKCAARDTQCQGSVVSPGAA